MILCRRCAETIVYFSLAMADFNVGETQTEALYQPDSLGELH
jgi:hypothetical protein